jgi:hypothetical protein
MKKVILILIFLCFTVILKAQNPLRIYPAYKTPTIDGYIDELGDPWGTFIDLTVRNPNSTTTGLNGKFKILAGKDAFYIAIVVQDATPNNDAILIPNSYERDCSEIYISMDTVTEPNGAYKVGCWQIRTQREGETLCDGNSGANTWSIATLTSDPDFRVESETSLTEYVQEMILPYDVLTAGIYPDWDYRFILFDICINDNTTGATGGRTEHRYWYGNNGKGDDTTWISTRSLDIAEIALGGDPAPTLIVSSESVTIPAIGGSNSTVKIKSDVVWYAESNQSWLTVNPSSGNGGDIFECGTCGTTLMLTAEANTTKKIRKATVEIISAEVPTETITVTQQAGTVGIPSEMEENLKIVPNPATDFFNISGLEEKATICIIDLNGRLLLKKQISDKETIPVHSLSPGLYFVKVITDAGTIKKKLIKK